MKKRNKVLNLAISASISLAVVFVIAAGGSILVSMSAGAVSFGLLAFLTCF